MSYKFGKFWPLAVWPPVLFLLNPDLWIIPALRKAGTPFEWVLIIAVITALVDLFYTFWCWKRAWRELGEVQKIREVRRQLRQDGWFDRRFVDYVLAFYHGVIDPDGKFLQLMKRKGLPILFVLCASPLPGPRTPTAIFCAIGARSPCLGVLAICDVIHVIGVAYLWELLFWIGRELTHVLTYLLA